MTQKKEISRTEYQQLEGLLVIARRHRDAIKEIEEAAGAICGQVDDGYGYFGVVSDAIYNEDTARGLLKKLGLKIRSPRASS